ncbi:MAG TPA: hypothetical protein VKP65_06840 [Rhodothermales bacterium]|nr:hypothetical protein [Rhodothermales bacterium]
MKTSTHSSYLSRRFFSLLFAALLFVSPILLGACDTIDPGLETEDGTTSVLAKSTQDGDRPEEIGDGEDDSERDYKDNPTFVVTEMAEERPEEDERTRVEGYTPSKTEGEDQEPEPGEIYYLKTPDENPYEYTAEIVRVLDENPNPEDFAAEYILYVEIEEVYYKVVDFY